MSNKGRVTLIGLLLMVLLVAASRASAASTGVTTLVSRHTNGTQGNAASNSPSISADGRIVTFSSAANNLVGGDTNDMADVFAYDRITGQTSLISRHTNGAQGSGAAPSISGDGRYVAFTSGSAALVDNDTNGLYDIFVHDRTTGQTGRVSLRSDGAEANGYSSQPAISGDGRFVAFVSQATNLVDGDANGVADVFVHDRGTGQTTLVSRHTNGTQADPASISESPTISGDGRYIAFSSTANTLTDGDLYHVNDIFVHDRTTGQTTMISQGPGIHTGYHYAPSISADGRYVAFQTYPTWPYLDDCGDRIYRYDTQTGTAELASRFPNGGMICLDSTDPAISADGRYVAFVHVNCMGGQFCGNGWNYQVLQRDLQLGQTFEVSVTPPGIVFGNDDALEPVVSGDGQFIAFSSIATNLVAGDANGLRDVFLRERPYTISGTVREANGDPISGVTVLLNNSFSASYAYTDQNGAYTLVGVPPGQHIVTVSSNHYSFATNTRQVTVPPYATGIDFTGVNTRPYTISGTIRDGAGNPLPYIPVYFEDGDGNFIDYLDTATGDDGAFSVDVAPGEYTVWPSSDEYNFPAAPLTVTTPPDATEVDFTGYQTTDHSFIAMEDAYVSQGAPAQNFGEDIALGVRDDASDDLTTYIKFDISGLDPCGEVIYGVLDLSGSDDGFDGGTLHSVGNSWTEGGITWNNAPAISGSPIGYVGPFESSAHVPVTSQVTGNGIYSFAIKGRTSNTVWYDSTESGSETPSLWLRVQSAPEGAPPTAAFSAAPLSGLAPLAVNFTDQSTNCPTSWSWDFGDGGTSTQRHPSHTYTAPGTYTVSLTATNANGSDGETKTAYITVTAPPPPSPSLYAVPATAGSAGGVAATPQDILYRDGTAGTWAMHFDGSDVGVTKAIAAFARLSDGDLLLVLKANQSLPGVGAVTPWDVVRFTPTSLGNTTAGTFTWHVDGSDVGLTTSAEKIDALDVLADGRVLVSTGGTLAVPKPGGGTLKSQDEDLTALTLTSVGATTSGTWALYFDGTAVPGLGAEDVAGAHVAGPGGDIYVNITGAFNVGGVGGNGKDVLKLTPAGGSYTVTMYWRGGNNGFNLNLGGIEFP